jgi:hypothetical protein
MRTRIDEATLLDLIHVAQNLRQSDRDELAHTRNTNDALALANDAYYPSLFSYVASYDGEPIFAFGAVEAGPGLVQVWGFGSEDTPKIIRGVTKFVVRYIVPKLRAAGVTQAQCLIHEDNFLSRRWLEFMGFQSIATLPDLGAGHEGMLLYLVADHASPLHPANP